MGSSPASAAMPSSSARPTSAGPIMPTFECEGGRRGRQRTPPRCRSGELVVRAWPAVVIRGYHQPRGGHRRSRSSDGWFHTGDIVTGRRRRLRLHRRPGQGHGVAGWRERLLRGSGGRHLRASQTSPRRRCSGWRTSGWARRSPPRSCLQEGGSELRRTRARRPSGRRGMAKFKQPETGLVPRPSRCPSNANGKFLKRELRETLVGD